MADSEVSIALLKRALESYGDHYKDLNETWRGLDTKAQGTAAVAGVFIAASFAFVAKLPAGLGGAARALLGLALLLLAATVVAAMSSMFVRTVRYPPSGPGIFKLVKDIREAGDPESGPSDRLPAFYQDQQRLWDKCIQDCQGKLDSKASLLKWAQGLLTASALIAVVLALVALCAA